MNKIQSEVKKFVEENNMESPIETRILDLISELGEVAKEILKSSKYGKEKASQTENLEMELGDVQYSLFTVANYFNIDLEEATDKVLEKYKNRISKKGNAGSGN